MKTMITGGDRGLGMHLARRYNADTFSRSSGFDIGQDARDLAALSLDYDLVINNAYDGFGQTLLLAAVADIWTTAGKAGTIINIGGVGSEDTGPPATGWQSYLIIFACSQAWLVTNEVQPTRIADG